MPKVKLISGQYAPLTAEIKTDGDRIWIMTGTFVKNWYYLLTGNVSNVEIITTDPSGITFECCLKSGETFQAITDAGTVHAVMGLM